MSAPEVPPLFTQMAALDRRLERLDLRIDAALDQRDQAKFQDLLSLRDVLLSERAQLAGIYEPPC